MSNRFHSREELIEGMCERLRSVQVDPEEFDLEKIASQIEEVADGYPISKEVLESNE